MHLEKKTLNESAELLNIDTVLWRAVGMDEHDTGNYR